MTSQVRGGIGHRDIGRGDRLLDGGRRDRCGKSGIARRDRERGCGIGVAHREGLRLYIIGTRTRSKTDKIYVTGLDISRARYLYIAEVFVADSSRLGIHFYLGSPAVERIGQGLPILSEHIQRSNPHPHSVYILVEITVATVSHPHNGRIFSFKGQDTGFTADIILGRRYGRELSFARIIEYIALGIQRKRCTQ